MRANSLALRLFFSATTWIVVILVLAGIVLSGVYRSAVERAFDRRIDVYLRALVADVANPDETSERFPQSLSESRFELPLSGWYWQVTRLDTARPEVRSSRSLWDSTLPHLDDRIATTTGVRQGYIEGPGEQRLRVVERIIDLGDEGRFVVGVAGDAAEIEEEMRTFDRALMATFAVLAIVLLLTTTFQVRYGLAPLKKISEGLAAVRSGASERLEGSFPVEVAPLVRETNALLDANREIVNRARTHVGNLAHALKTPISVMMNEAASQTDDPLAVKVREQTEIMRDQVTRHLERARLATRVPAIGTVVEVRPVVTALARTMEKIHHGRGVAIEIDAPEEARFRGERQDLEEMVGNLVDNACKWGQSRVSIEAFPDHPEADAGRGRRLDESKPGSGLGLSIVMELASLYGGRLTLGTAPIGGLRAELVLPGA
jgi:signal transduction histidine kinase